METYCPMCAADATIRLQLAGDFDTFDCTECGEEFTAETLDGMIASCQRLLRMAKAAKAAGDK